MRDWDIAQARLTCGHIYKRPFSLLVGVGMPATCALPQLVLGCLAQAWERARKHSSSTVSVLSSSPDFS